MTNIAGKILILLLFLPVSLAHAFYEGAIGFRDGFMIEWEDFVRLMKNDVRKW